MDIVSQIQSMSVQEKIKTMEAIWDDLIRTADAIEPPSWHEDVLSAREDSIKTGKNEFIDWDNAKQEILKKINEN